MRSLRAICLVAATFWLASAAWGADRYAIDRSHTSIGFSVRHMVISNVPGRFTEFSGEILYDEEDISKSSVNVTIQAASVNTDNERRDNDLRSANFFEVEKHPEITFRSTQVKKQGDGLLCTGILTMHGVSKEITFPFKILGVLNGERGSRMGAEARLALDRRDFDMKFSRTLDNGGLIVGNEVDITLNVEAIHRKARSEQQGSQDR